MTSLPRFIASLVLFTFVFPSNLVRAEPPRVVTRVLATVNGSAVTADDVEKILGGKDAKEDVVRTTVQQLVIERLIDQKSKEAHVDVTDDRLSEALANRIKNCGGKAGYGSFLRRIGRTLDQDRMELRHALEGEEYIARCLGEVPDGKLLRPELARSLQVSEVEMRTCWNSNRDQFRKKGRVHVVRVSASKKKFTSGDEAKEFLTKVLSGHVASDLESIAKANDKLDSSELTFDENSAAGLIDDLRPTVLIGSEGAISGVAETDEAFLVVGVVKRDPDVVVSYADAQEMVRLHLVAQKRIAAVKSLVDGLIASAKIWPDDLFPRPEKNAPDGTGEKSKPASQETKRP